MIPGFLQNKNWLLIKKTFGWHFRNFKLVRRLGEDWRVVVDVVDKDFDSWGWLDIAPRLVFCEDFQTKRELFYECQESAILVPDEGSLLAIYWGGQKNISVRQDRKVRVLAERELDVVSSWICLKTSRTQPRPVDLPAGPWLRNLPAIEFPLRLLTCIN